VASQGVTDSRQDECGGPDLVNGGTFIALPSRPSVTDCIFHGPPTLRMFRPAPPAPATGLVADEAQGVAADPAVIDTDADGAYGGGVDRRQRVDELDGGRKSCAPQRDTPTVEPVRMSTDFPGQPFGRGDTITVERSRYIGASRLPRPQA
jgi:hypothetical protein